MNFPRLSLQLLLAFIAAVALAGAACSIFSWDVSNLMLPLAFVLLVFPMIIPLLFLLHRSAFRNGGLILCTLFLAILAALIFAAAKWFEDDKIWTSALIVFSYGFLIGIGSFLRAKPWAKVFRITLSIICAISAILLLIPVWASISGSTFPDAVLSVDAALIPATLLLLNIGRGDKRYFRWVGIPLALAAAILGILAALDDDSNSAITFTFHLATLIVYTLALINTLLMTSRPGLVKIFQRLAILLTTLVGLASIALAVFLFLEARELFKIEHLTDWLIRSFSATAFLAFGSILSLITARQLLRIKSTPISPANLTTLLFTCPSCNTASTTPLRGSCPHCLLQFKITLIEPHCPQCDHILLNLLSDRCPECGLPIPRPSAIVPSIP